MNKVKIGVIGVGHLGRFHTKLYSEIPEVDLIGVFDTDPERSAQIAEEYSVKSYDNLDDLLALADGVSIVTATQNHFNVAQHALEHDCHIFVEKPVTVTIEQARKLVAIAEEKKRVFQVGHIERFSPAMQAIEGISINPLFIEVHRLASFTPRGADVAVVLDLMIHDIDLILSFVKSPIAKLSASGTAVISDTEDIANCRIQFENGCVANLTASRISAKKMRKMRIFQKDAYFSIDFDEGVTEVFHTDDLKLEIADKGDSAISLGALEHGKSPIQIHYSKLRRQNVNALKTECELFAKAILTGNDAVVKGEDGLNALVVADMILKEMKKHREKINSNRDEV